MSLSFKRVYHLLNNFEWKFIHLQKGDDLKLADIYVLMENIFGIKNKIHNLEQDKLQIPLTLAQKVKLQHAKEQTQSDYSLFLIKENTVIWLLFFYQQNLLLLLNTNIQVMYIKSNYIFPRTSLRKFYSFEPINTEEMVLRDMYCGVLHAIGHNT